MAMVWDALLVSALAEELKTLLGGARLRAHRFAWDRRELTLYFREGTLLWQLHPRRGRLSFSQEAHLPEEARPLSANVLGVTAPADERLLRIRLRRERGRVRHLQVVIELMTNQWNALLLEGEEERIRHLLWTRRLEERTLAIGQPYLPPSPSDRLGIREPLDEGEWRALLAGKDLESARRTLLERIAFTSPVNLSFLLEPWPQASSTAAQTREAAAGKEGQALGPTEDPLHDHLAGGFRRWQQLQDPTRRQPCILEIDGDEQAYPYVLHNFEAREFPDLLTAVQAASEGNGLEIDPGGEALERLEHALARGRKRVRGIRKELAQAADPEEPRNWANLLLARLGDVPRGAEAVVLPGFDGGEVRIPLDPASSPQENAGNLYREAARRERARARLPELLEEARKEVLALEELKGKLESGSLTAREVAPQIPISGRSPPSVGKEGKRLPYRRYYSSGGLEIRVGRSSRDNDELTFRNSDPEDIWLHARDGAGAHVILRWTERSTPPRKDLAEAAVLAALNSSARTSGTVPVDWTRRKHVRKARKSPPGTVVPQRVQTLFVEPDPDLPERLRKGDPEGGG